MSPKLPASSNYLRAPFIFVPHGAPKPVEWMAAHPGWVSFSATFRPRPMLAPRDSADLETRSSQAWREEDQAPGMVPPPDWQRPHWQRPGAPPPQPQRRPPRPPVLGPADVETPGRHLGMRLSTPEGRAALLAETRQIRAYLERFSNAGAVKPPSYSRQNTFRRGAFQPNTAINPASILVATPNTGAPNSWYVNPGSGQMRFFGPDGYPSLDIDSDHSHPGIETPHMHVWLPAPGFPIRQPPTPLPLGF